MKYNSWYIVILFLFLHQSVVGQTARAELDPDTIRIGEQATVSLHAKTKEGQDIIFPEVADTLTSAVEVLDVSGIDTTISDELYSYTRRLTITSFDSGTYHLPAFRFTVNRQGQTDTLSTKSLRLSVQSVIVDTSQAAKDIKPVTSVPPPPPDYSWMWWLLLLIPIAALAYFIIKKLKNRPEKPEPAVPEIPAHIRANEELDKLEKEKLWQKGHYKEFHSRLSGIIRLYTEKRFHVPAMEQTSGEIMSFLRNSGIVNQENQEKLASVLHLSDMVKFAKTVPSENENELSMKKTREFVRTTTPEEEEDSKE